MSTSASRSIVYECQHTCHTAMQCVAVNTHLIQLQRCSLVARNPVCCSVFCSVLLCCSVFCSVLLFIWKPPKKETPPPVGGISYDHPMSTCMSTKGEASPFQGGYLPPGSPLGKHIKRKPPRGGVSYDQHACQQTHHPALNMHVNKHITQNGKDP